MKISGEAADHVMCLKHLPLVARAIAIQRKRHGLIIKVLLREYNARATGTWAPTMPFQEQGYEDVHGTAHVHRVPEQLVDNTLDGAATEDGEGVAAVSGVGDLASSPGGKAPTVSVYKRF
jgi:hypothetical protein